MAGLKKRPAWAEWFVLAPGVGPRLLNAGRSKRGWSRIGTFGLCPQKWSYQELLGIELIAAKPLKCGSIGHVMQAHLLGREGARQGGCVANDVWLDDPGHLLKPLDAGRQWAEENDAVEHYDEMAETFRRYAVSQVVPGRVMAVEHELVGVLTGTHQEPRLTLARRYDMSAEAPQDWVFPDLEPLRLHNGEPVVLTRRADAVLMEHDGAVTIWDHKHTGAEVDAGRARTAYAVDGGFCALHILGEQLAGQIHGGTRLNIVQRREPYAVMQPLVGPAPAAVRAFPRRLLGLERRRLQLEEEGVDPWEYPGIFNEASGCEGKYGLCAAIELCLRGKPAA